MFRALTYVRIRCVAIDADQSARARQAPRRRRRARAEQSLRANEFGGSDARYRMLGTGRAAECPRSAATGRPLGRVAEPYPRSRTDAVRRTRGIGCSVPDEPQSVCVRRFGDAPTGRRRNVRGRVQRRALRNIATRATSRRGTAPGGRSGALQGADVRPIGLLNARATHSVGLCGRVNGTRRRTACIMCAQRRTLGASAPCSSPGIGGAGSGRGRSQPALRPPIDLTRSAAANGALSGARSNDWRLRTRTRIEPHRLRPASCRVERLRSRHQPVSSRRP